MNRLYRSRQNKVFAGICGGMGDYFKVDPVFVRIIAVILFFAMGGIPLLVYFIAIFVIPIEPLEAADIERKDGMEKGAASKESITASRDAHKKRMEDHVKILGSIYIAFSALMILFALIVFAAITGGGLISGDDEAIAITSLVGSLVAGLMILISAPGIIGGIGLLKNQAWARVLVLVLGIINLINIPFGTALGIYTIWVLTNKEAQ
jgi:phage shock protein PspC (stress-responsive transcriptional regulator)